MPKTTIAQAKTMFLESIELPHSANTLQTYKKALETFSNMLVTQQIDPSHVPVAELTENSVARFVDHVKGLSPATESLYLQVIKSFCEFLDAQDLAEVNLSRVRMLIRQRIRRSRRQPVPYPEDDISRLIEFMSHMKNVSKLNSDVSANTEMRNMRDRALILTLADTGLRVDEICKLQSGDIDWEAGRAILNGRGNKRAVVRFSTRALNALRDYLYLRASFDLETDGSSSALPLFARHDKGAGKKNQANYTYND